MKTLTVTVDTSVWIAWINRQVGFDDVSKLLEWHKKNFLELWNTSRVLQDTAGMDTKQSESLQALFEEYGIQLSPCPARYNYSVWNGPDIYAGSSIEKRSAEEIIKFRKMIPEPTSLSKDQIGNKLSNKLGDYDALKNHYEKNRDVFLTRDKRDIFHKNKRPLYRAELGLIILDPADFIVEYHSYWE